MQERLAMGDRLRGRRPAIREAQPQRVVFGEGEKGPQATKGRVIRRERFDINVGPLHIHTNRELTSRQRAQVDALQDRKLQQLGDDIEMLMAGGGEEHEGGALD